MVKTRINRKRKSNRTRRMRGGANQDSCKKYPNAVVLLEDKGSVVGPLGKICYGDEFTTCMVITVVMENNYKIGAHINPYNFLTSTNDRFLDPSTPRQNLNPETVLPYMQNIMRTVPQFQSSRIKYIYVITAMYGLYVVQTPSGFRTNINNNQSGQARRKAGSSVELTDINKRDFFERVFPGKLTDRTQITLLVEQQVQYQTSGGRAHFIIREDGSLDLTT